MLFNSLPFLIFFLTVLCVYWLLPHAKQNTWLLFVSYFFYGWWDWRFLGLLLIVTFISYFFALRLEKASSIKTRKRWLSAGLVFTFSFLIFFKYFGFVLSNVVDLFQGFGFALKQPAWSILLPIGISFYTFQAASYLLDVYRCQISAEKRLDRLALYIVFFPQLIAGPIERAGHLLTQIKTPRKVAADEITSGIFMITWGLYQKVFIADNLALLANSVLSSPDSHTAWQLGLALYAFAIQIYCDFAGYSNIACGLAKCLGFDLMINFNFPYFATSICDFWRRWHISLSIWIRDYLYIPLGGNRHGRGRTAIHLLLTMLLAGLWHGAGWNFILWGAYHGLLLILSNYWTNGRLEVPITDGIKSWLLRLCWFHVICVGWFFFRISDMQHAWHLLQCFGDWSLHSQHGTTLGMGLALLFYSVPLFTAEYFCYKNDNLLFFLRTPVWLQSIIWIILFYSILVGGATLTSPFIYFQF